MSDDISDVVRALRPYLRQYLEQSGTKVSPTGKFLCPFPEKHDTEPSASMVPDSAGTIFKCFGCQRSGNIYTVANLKEGLPLRGKEFITKTVYGLAKRFGIPFQPQNLSDEDTDTINLQQVYEDTYTVLRDYYMNKKHIVSRGWSEGLCYQLGVATVTSWDGFLAKLKSLRNYSKAELDAADIKPKLFNPEVITFTLFDEFGRPVGFAARDTRYNESERRYPKYTNTSTNAVYNKRSVLYGFHIARQLPGPLILVEGYADVLTAMTHQIYGVAAVCGATPTPQQVDLIERYNKRDVILALDYDVKLGPDGKPTGQSKTEQFIDAYVKGRKNLRLRVTDWASISPAGKVDLDSFLVSKIKQGVTSEEARIIWDQVPKLSGFEWRLKNLPADMPAEDMTQQMIPIIAAEPVFAKQETLLKTLSQRSGIRIEALQRDLDALLDLQAREVTEGIRDVTTKAFYKLKYASPEEAESLLQEAHSAVRNLVDSTSKSKRDAGSTIDAVQEVLDRFAKKEDVPTVGVRTGFPVFDDKMSGLCSGMWVFGGFATSGKTSSCAQLSWNVVNLNEDAIVLVMTLDDSLDAFIARYLAIQTGFYIGHTVHPAKYIFPDPARTEAYSQARAKVTDLVTSCRLDVRDATYGSTSKSLEKWIQITRKRYPDRKIIAFLDNFHNLSDAGDSETVRFSRASKCIHNITEATDTCIILTAELTKNSDRSNPTRSGLKETGTLEYDAKGIIMVHNDLAVNMGSQKVWVDPTDNNLRKPILDWNIEKNKNLYGVWTGNVPIKFDPARSRLVQYAETPRPISAGIMVPQPQGAAPTARFQGKWE